MSLFSLMTPTAFSIWLNWRSCPAYACVVSLLPLAPPTPSLCAMAFPLDPLHGSSPLLRFLLMSLSYIKTSGDLKYGLDSSHGYWYHCSTTVYPHNCCVFVSPCPRAKLDMIRHGMQFQFDCSSILSLRQSQIGTIR